MIKIKDFFEKNLCVNWKVVYIGYSGSEIFKDSLVYDDIMEYAISKIKEESLVLKLLSYDKEEKDKISETLKKLAEQEKSSEEIALEKWRVLYVIKNLPSENVSFLGGILALGEIWTKLGFPDDSPHVFQGRNNNVSPKNYYTYENFMKLYKLHLDWIVNKLKILSD